MSNTSSSRPPAGGTMSMAHNPITAAVQRIRTLQADLTPAQIAGQQAERDRVSPLLRSSSYRVATHRF